MQSDPVEILRVVKLPLKLKVDALNEHIKLCNLTSCPELILDEISIHVGKETLVNSAYLTLNKPHLRHSNEVTE